MQQLPKRSFYNANSLSFESLWLLSSSLIILTQVGRVLKFIRMLHRFQRTKPCQAEKLDSPELVSSSWTFFCSLHWNEWDRTRDAASRFPSLDPRLSLKPGDQKCVSIRKIWPQYPVLPICHNKNRGVSCESFHAEHKHSWASGVGSLYDYLWYHLLFLDLVVDFLGLLVTAHLLCLCRAHLALIDYSQWQHKILVLLSLVASLLLKWYFGASLLRKCVSFCLVVFPLFLRLFFKIFFWLDFWGHRLGAAAASLLPVFDLFLGRQPVIGQKDEMLHRQIAFYPEAAELTPSQGWTDTHNKSSRCDVK